MGEIMRKEVRALLNDPVKRHLILDVYLRRKRDEEEQYRELARRLESARRAEKPVPKPDSSAP